MRALLIQSTPLGSIVDTLPAVTDAARARSQLGFDWVCDSALADVPRHHSAVDRVITCRPEQWRKHPLELIGSGEWGHFREQLRQTPYDLILDPEGRLRNVLTAFQARGPLVGPRWRAARNGPATLCFRRRYPLPPRSHAHAVERCRRLFAEAFDYALPTTPPDAGLEIAPLAPPDAATPCVALLIGSHNVRCRWPEAAWTTLGQWLREHGHVPLLIARSEAEVRTAQRIAAAGGGQLPTPGTLAQLGGRLAHARAFVAVDNGLARLAAALGTPGVTLYGPTGPHLRGTLGPRQVHLSPPHGEDLRAANIAVDSVTTAVHDLLRKPSR